MSMGKLNDGATSDRTYINCILNKIRAEIVTEGDRVVGEGEYFTGFHLGMICSLKIIDKYKEGEEE